jgi:hypothetical protein
LTLHYSIFNVLTIFGATLKQVPQKQQM